MFGFRSGPAGAWLEVLKDLEQEPGFRKSLVFKNRLDRAQQLLEQGTNIWRDRIDSWQLLTVPPYAVGCTPDPSILAQAADAKQARLVGYVDGYKSRYGVADAQLAVAKYREEFDANTAELEKLEANQEMPGFIESPPMTPR